MSLKSLYLCYLRHIVEKIIRIWSACLTGALGIVDTEKGTDLKDDTPSVHHADGVSFFSRRIFFFFRVRTSRSRERVAMVAKILLRFSQLWAIGHRDSRVTPSSRIGRTIWMLHETTGGQQRENTLTTRDYTRHTHAHSHGEKNTARKIKISIH